MDGLVDTAGITQAVASWVCDAGRIVTSPPGAPLATERGTVTMCTFVPNYARNQAALVRLWDLASEGRLSVRVALTLVLSEAARAHERLEKGGLRGRIVMTF